MYAPSFFWVGLFWGFASVDCMTTRGMDERPRHHGADFELTHSELRPSYQARGGGAWEMTSYCTTLARSLGRPCFLASSIQRVFPCVFVLKGLSSGPDTVSFLFIDPRRLSRVGRGEGEPRCSMSMFCRMSSFSGYRWVHRTALTVRTSS